MSDNQMGQNLVLLSRSYFLSLSLIIQRRNSVAVCGRVSKVIIIAVTSFAMAGDRERYLKGGFHGYIEKPIDPYRFVKEIEEICQKTSRS